MKKYTMTVFSQPTCGPCNEFKKYLNDKNITFTDKDVTADPDAGEEFISKGFQFTPTSIIEVDGETHTIVGGNLPRIEELLGL